MRVNPLTTLDLIAASSPVTAATRRSRHRRTPRRRLLQVANRPTFGDGAGQTPRFIVCAPVGTIRLRRAQMLHPLDGFRRKKIVAESIEECGVGSPFVPKSLRHNEKPPMACRQGRQRATPEPRTREMPSSLTTRSGVDACRPGMGTDELATRVRAQESDGLLFPYIPAR